MESIEQKPAVHSTTGKGIQIIGGICEFCGIKASACAHTQAFIANGQIERSEESNKDEEKIYADFTGLPKCINKVCEFCGVDPLTKPEIDKNGEKLNVTCAHSEERRRLAFGAASQATTPIIEPQVSQQKPTEQPQIESSGDPEMDKMMNDDEQTNQ